MKFTKDDARKELSTLLAAKGEKLNLSERSLNEQLDTLIPLVANEEMELADFVAKVFPIFKTADANVRNDVSAGINDYKKQNPLPTPKKDDDPAPDAALVARLAALEERFAKDEKAKKIEGIRSSIAAKLKEKGVKDSEWTSGMLNEIAIDEEVDVEAKATSLLNLYNKMMAGLGSDMTPKNAGGGSVDKELEDIIKQASEMAASQSLDANK